MKIVNFSDKTFKEIPKQDNPAFMTKKEWDLAGQRGCILITKQEKQTAPYKNVGRFCVFEIELVHNPKEEDSVNNLGHFWEIENAILFAEAYIEDRE